MREAKLDQRGLARKIKASSGVVYGWMEEGILPAGKYMILLPAALGVSGHYLLTGDGKPDLPDAGVVAAFRQAQAAAAADLTERVRRAVTEALSIGEPQTSPGARAIRARDARERGLEEEKRAGKKRRRSPPKPLAADSA